LSFKPVARKHYLDQVTRLVDQEDFGSHPLVPRPRYFCTALVNCQMSTCLDDIEIAAGKRDRINRLNYDSDGTVRVLGNGSISTEGRPG
jgi:hypothetical protein